MAEPKWMRELREEIEDAQAGRAAIQGKPPMERLIDAARRSIDANMKDRPIGKDGRQRIGPRKITAEGDMADALREMGLLPGHNFGGGSSEAPPEPPEDQ